MLRITAKEHEVIKTVRPLVWTGDMCIAVRNDCDLSSLSPVKGKLCLVLYDSFIPLEGIEKGLTYSMPPDKHNKYFMQVEYAYVTFTESEHIDKIGLRRA